MAAERFDPKALIEAMEPHSLRYIARRLGIDPAVLCRPLTANQADTYAIRLGMLPGDIWGADWYRPESK